MKPRKIFGLVAAAAAGAIQVALSFGGKSIFDDSKNAKKYRPAFVALVALSAWLLFTGCASNRAEFRERTTATNGVTTERTLAVNTRTAWPATSEIGKQRASLGKTFSLGQSELSQEGGGTNVTDALRSLDSILSKIRP